MRSFASPYHLEKSATATILPDVSKDDFLRPQGSASKDRTMEGTVVRSKGV
jgi:hypothetical protein